MGQEGMRRGLWSEEEDVRLAYHVKLFGDRRWDFISKVSGLKRTGKSCRLRWVNYLDPSLKRGKLTPHEEKLVLQLHSKWGNRWSKIAAKLSGRTDNEIKNFWRTYMRHKAQEKKRGTSLLVHSASTSSFSSSLESNNPSIEANSSSSDSKNSLTVDPIPGAETKETSFYDTGGIEMVSALNMEEKVYSLDDIWSDVDKLQESEFELFGSRMGSPIWNDCLDIPWTVEEDETQIYPIMTDDVFGDHDQV